MLRLSASQARSLDRAAQRRFGLSTLVLMENAGAALARHACSLYPQGRIAVVCGKGNNGGDGFVAARHLLARGRKVEVFALRPAVQLRGDAALNAAALKRCGGMIMVVSPACLAKVCRRIASAGLVIDALLGTGLSDEVQGVCRGLIEAINRSRAKVISADLPSGLHADSGRVCGVCVRADITVTFIAPKQGMLKAAGPRMCGRIIVEPIGFPAYNKSKRSKSGV